MPPPSLSRERAWSGLVERVVSTSLRCCRVLENMHISDISDVVPSRPNGPLDDIGGGRHAAGQGNQELGRGDPAAGCSPPSRVRVCHGQQRYGPSGGSDDRDPPGRDRNNGKGCRLRDGPPGRRTHTRAGREDTWHFAAPGGPSDGGWPPAVSLRRNAP